MRDATNIQLDELIVHILDPRNPDGMVLSECAIPLEENQLLRNYFINHVKNSLKLSTANAAVFEAIDEKIVSGICNDLLKGTIDLVKGSSKLAEKLYDIIAEDKRINACDLAVCFYRAECDGITSKYLALLNIEPSEVFRHEMKTDSEGNTYIDFKIEKDVMPTTGEQLQKCAFIQNLNPRSNYDMILVDRQKRGQEVAKFFVKDFLGAKPALDTQQRTKKLYESLRLAHNKLRLELKPEQDKSLDQAIRVAIKSTHINVETWVDALPISKEHKNVITQTISQKTESLILILIMLKLSLRNVRFVEIMA